MHPQTRRNHIHKSRLFNRQPTVKCFWCGIPQRFKVATVDHVLALCLGGNDDHANTVISCRQCNTNRSFLQMVMNWIRTADLIETEMATHPELVSTFRHRSLRRLRKVIARHKASVNDAFAMYERDKYILQCIATNTPPVLSGGPIRSTAPSGGDAMVHSILTTAAS